MVLRIVLSHCRGVYKPPVFRNLSYPCNITSCFMGTQPPTSIKKKKPIMITPRKAGSLPNAKLIINTQTRKKNIEGTIVDDLESIPPYCEVDPYNSKLVKMLTAVKTKKQRYTNMMMMLEGKRLIQEALDADVQPLLILFSDKNLLKGLRINPEYISPENTIVHYLPYRHIKVWSSLSTTPGLIGIFRMPNMEYNDPISTPLPITFVCDNIRDPGNLGSLLRVAAALPVQKVVLLAGCVDLWDPKVIRGSCGAMFYLKILNNASWEDVEDNCSGNVILADHEHYNEVEEQADKNIKAEEFYEDPEALFTNNEYEDEDDDIDRKTLRNAYPLPVKAYSDIEYTNNKSYVVVIGGETEGLSEESFKFARFRNGIRVHVPLCDTVNSLNSSIALGIISFEIKRQLSQFF